MKLVFVSFLFIISIVAKADYLLVQRNGNLREAPTTDAEILEKIKAGDSLVLLDQEQSNGYYNVVSWNTGQQGWVYRTLVRRMEGELSRDAIVAAPAGVVDIRVVDVGAGLCNLIKFPGNKYVIYDAGGKNTSNGAATFSAIQDYIPSGSTIELLVLSHTDADHIVAAEQVIRNYHVKKLLWTGYERSMISGLQPTVAFRRLIDALEDRPQTKDVNLNELDSVIAPGIHKTSIGGAVLTFLCGFGKPPAEWGSLDQAEKLNSVSIVMKLEYGGSSVLFCGDAVGRHRDDPEDALIATEKFLVQNAGSLLRSTVVIAPHHGARNGSSTAFVELVQPKAVVFSAGHSHHHPTMRTANLYLRHVTASQIFRTDRGDDEGGSEWNYGRISNCRDREHDDDIHIQLRSNGTYRVYYLQPEQGCR